MTRKILNAGLLDLLRDVNDVVQKKRGVVNGVTRKEWRDLVLLSEKICLGWEVVSERRLIEIERKIIFGAQEFNVKVRREPRGGSEPLALVENSRPLRAAAE
jgi:hypothetical protein